jgi:hypothetical protein
VNQIPISEWAHHAAAQTHVDCYTWNCLGEISLSIEDVPDDGKRLIKSRGFDNNHKWKTLTYDEQRGPTIDAAEVREAEWAFARDRSNYWDLDKLCEVDLAIVGRWPVNSGETP